MESKITYHQQMSYCGKARCRKCRNGAGHGPYWYAYQMVNGHIKRTYVGKILPPGVQANSDNDVPMLSSSAVAASFPELLPSSASITSPPFSSDIQLDSVQVGRIHQIPLVGREKERHTLHTLLLRVERNQREHNGRPEHAATTQKRVMSSIPLDTQRSSQCVMLMGEAGIGKTRLAEELGREAQGRGWAVLWSRVYAQESGIPYRVWTEILRKTIELSSDLVERTVVVRPQQTKKTPDTPPEPKAQQYGRGAPLRSPMHDASSRSPVHNTSWFDRPDILRPLASLLPELSASLPISSAPQAMEPEREQLRLREAVRELLTTISEKKPLLIVLDDIQWADGSSHELLGYLARHSYGYPILLVATCRENEAPRALSRLIDHMQREHTVTIEYINPLTSEEIGKLVSHTSQLSEPLVRHIQVQAAGNPFFAEELARGTPPRLPDTIAAALDSRLNNLSSECRTLLRNASVLGGSFEFPVIHALEVKRASDAADEDALFDLLDEALQSGVLTEEGMGAHVVYSFWHPLLVSHLYDSFSATRRTQIHRRAAEILLRIHRGREEEVAATIAHHLVHGGAESSRIAYFAELAGNRAYALLAYPEAERHYKLAVEHLAERIGTLGKGSVESGGGVGSEGRVGNEGGVRNEGGGRSEEGMAGGGKPRHYSFACGVFDGTAGGMYDDSG